MRTRVLGQLSCSCPDLQPIVFRKLPYDTMQTFCIIVLQPKKEEERLCLTLPLHVNIFRILQAIFLFLVFVDLWPPGVLCVCRIELCSRFIFLCFSMFFSLIVYLWFRPSRRELPRCCFVLFCFLKVPL